jgi:hypothetical protein
MTYSSPTVLLQSLWQFSPASIDSCSAAACKAIAQVVRLLLYAAFVTKLVTRSHAAFCVDSTAFRCEL